jgi:acyl-coenzyme A thioesterase PaaI-like protein
MPNANSVLATWRRMSRSAAGRYIFSRAVCWRAPYFSSIKPRFTVLEPGRCEVRIEKRRSILNHIGTVHAIAMCNMAELAAGAATEVSIPTSLRWIPKGMTVDYLGKATSALRATATIDAPRRLEAAREVPVHVQIVDRADQPVLSAVIRMWVSPKPPRT